MKSEKLEVVKGSGNVFRDLGHRMPMPISSRQFWPPRSSKRSTVTGLAFAALRAALGLRQRTSRASATPILGGSLSIA